MATIGSTWLNLIDMQKTANPKGGVWPVAELLALTNPILDDAIAVECNAGLKHMTSIRTGLPDTAWGAIYEGIIQSKSQRQNVEDTTGFLEAMSSVDKRLIELYPGREGAIRLQEAQAFLEAMNQRMARGMFYANEKTSPKEFTGLGPRYSKLGTSGSGRQIIDAGGTENLTSLWFVTWSENATHLIYPQGTQAGIKRENKGEQRVLDDNGRPYFVLEELFRWHIGMSIRDWRYNVRIANIDIEKVQDGTLNLYNLLRTAYYRLQSRRQLRPGANFGKNGAGADPTIPMSRIAIYANTDILEALDKAGTNALGGSTDNFVRLVPKELEGKEVLTYRGIPIRETDALISNEERIV